MRFGIIGNLEKETVRSFVPEVLKWLKKRRVDFLVEERLAHHLNLPVDKFPRAEAKAFCNQCQLVISFGGDGTILSTARVVGKAGIPILGVKVGGMGFLAELAPEELFQSLEDIVKGRYEIEERMVLQAEIDETEQPLHYYALNDFVFDKGMVSRVIHITTFIDDEYLNTYIGDGLIISTPTGSTAYSLAAGGPILLPGMEAIIINPISPHTLGARPVVIPGDKQVRVKFETSPQKVVFSADGQVGKELSPGQSVKIQKADYRVKLVSYQGRSFYDVLRAKLYWGEDVRGA